MQVGLVLEQCVAPVPGGTGRYSRELAMALAASAPEDCAVSGVTAFHRSRRQVGGAPGRGLMVPDGRLMVPDGRLMVPGGGLTIPGVRIERLPLPRRALVAAWERGVGPRVPGDLVHAPTPLHPARRTRPLVVTVHDAVPWTHPQTLTPRGVSWHRAMVGRAARTADLVVVPTQAVADELARHLPLGEVLVVGEGVSGDLCLPPDAEQRAAAMNLPERYLLTVATLEPRKGLAQLVEALRHVPGIPLLCVGQDGWGDRTPLNEAAQGFGVDVRLMGRVADVDLAVLLDRATALVVPSLSEGFGLPLLEGMAAGLPVLTSDAPALVEVAGGAALAVPLSDLVDGLRQITTDEGLQARLAVAGPVRAANFTWNKAAEQLWRAYLNLREGDTEKA